MLKEHKYRVSQCHFQETKYDKHTTLGEEEMTATVYSEAIRACRAFSCGERGFDPLVKRYPSTDFNFDKSSQYPLQT